MTSIRQRLGVNIDHVATLRNARGSAYPDPVRAALVAQEAGADGITAHLREDRRHIRDADIDRLMDAIAIPLNFEMATTSEMQAIALRHRPHAVCLVPEKREERTTEGGLDVAADIARLKDFVWVEEIIDLVEQEASCELYGLLKRPDEKQVTERAYNNPKFVEDMVRDVAARLNQEDRISAYVVESENFESIHNHSAYALIEKDKQRSV